MKAVRSVVLPVLVVIVVFAGAIVIAGAEDEAGVKLPGITAADEHPNGCVDCHANAGEGQDHRLNISVNEIEDHPDITAIVKTVPKDCGMCHRPNVAAGPLNLQAHRIHYEDPSENHFIEFYAGQCLECHGLNNETGVVAVKQGPKNW